MVSHSFIPFVILPANNDSHVISGDLNSTRMISLTVVGSWAFCLINTCKTVNLITVLTNEYSVVSVFHQTLGQRPLPQLYGQKCVLVFFLTVFLNPST